MRLRADSLAARTTTVHGGTSDKLNGLSQYTTALSRVRLNRGVKAHYATAHRFFSSVFLAFPFLGCKSHLEGARISSFL